MSRIDFLNNIFKIIKNDFNNFKSNKKITLSLVEDLTTFHSTVDPRTTQGLGLPAQPPCTVKNMRVTFNFPKS